MAKNTIILPRRLMLERLSKLISYWFYARPYHNPRSGFSTKPQRRPKEWCGVVGLEIHAQILAKSKMFSGSATTYGAPTNTQVAYFDAALPGTLPVLNQRCVEAGVMTALALNCQINKISTFDRKHYFYADMPEQPLQCLTCQTLYTIKHILMECGVLVTTREQHFKADNMRDMFENINMDDVLSFLREAGFQITQYRKPLAFDGKLEYVVPATSKKKLPIKKVAGITQIQLEVDSGKSLHDHEDQQSLIDLNRAGMGLMEIVTEPDFMNGDEAAAFLKELQLILVTLATCDGKMSEGSFRVDANISVHHPGENYGTRTEVKNINSIRNVSKAINFEIKRQIEYLEAGNKIQNETRSFDPETGETLPMRDKEDFQDYRFMPEPNLPPVYVYDDQSLPVTNSNGVNMDAIQSQIPVLPNQQRIRLQQDYNLPLDTINVLLFEPGMMSLFHNILAIIEDDQLVNVQNIANLLMNQFLTALHANDLSVDDSSIPASAFVDICIMVAKDEISKATVKNVMTELIKHPSKSVKNIVELNKWYQIKDIDQLTILCEEAISQNPSAVKKFKKGTKKAINPIIVHVLNATDGCANPQIMIEIIKKMLS